jgi:hypothetical protein
MSVIERVARSEPCPGGNPIGLASVNASGGCRHAVVLGGPLKGCTDVSEHVSVSVEDPVEIDGAKSECRLSLLQR